MYIHLCGFLLLHAGTIRYAATIPRADENEEILGTIPLDSHPEIDKIKRLPGVKIIDVNEENRDFITEAVVKDIMKAADSIESATFSGKESSIKTD